jgi:brefeldin A-inhibited guanine nucleotide-exchange protein
MLNDESRKDYLAKTQTRLVKICQNALQYYMVLPSESHRESWDNIILLLLTKIFKLETSKVIILFHFNIKLNIKLLIYSIY